MHELSFPNEHAKRMDEVQAIITLRSGKEIEQPIPKFAGKTKEQEEEESEHIVINQDSMKESMPPAPPPPISPITERKKEGFLARRHPGSAEAGQGEHPIA